jgi:hypothetical protein
MRISWLISFIRVLGAAACGNPSGGSGATTIQGTIGGATVATASTVAVVGPLVDTFGAFTSNGVTVVVSNISGFCSIAQHNATPANADALTLIVAAPDQVVPGIYPIATSPSASQSFGTVTYETTDAQCDTSGTHSAMSGSITLSSVSSTSVHGTFEVTMDTGEDVSGIFSASVCDVSLAGDAGPAACQN